MSHEKPKRGAVVAGHPRASAAGSEVLAKGGNATDAAIAMAGVLSVVRPHMCGLGGDVLALFLDGKDGTVHALNGSGRTGSLATPDFFRAAGGRAAALSVTVPGAVAAIVDAHGRFASIPLPELLAPAIRLAENGFPVSDTLAREFAFDPGPLLGKPETPFMPRGKVPPVGSLIRNPPLARTLSSIAEGGAESFYGESTGPDLSTFLQDHGGHVLPEDLASHRSTWTEALSARHSDLEILAFPPNTQGLAFLQQLEMAHLAGVGEMDPGTPEYLHTLIEIKKLAFADRNRWLGDPSFSEVPVDRLLDSDYLRGRVELVHPRRAKNQAQPGFGGREAGGTPHLSQGGDTVFLTAVDAEGNAVSWIQSIFSGFGSGLFHAETGVLFHNRASLMTLEEGHPNQVAPGKRPFHTLSPVLAKRGNEVAFTLGTPGADGQTQTLLQISLNHLVFGMAPGPAIEAPRFRSYSGQKVELEGRFDDGTVAVLQEWGHKVTTVEPWANQMGGAQMILDDWRKGILVAAADSRREARAEVL